LRQKHVRAARGTIGTFWNLTQVARRNRVASWLEQMDDVRRTA